MFSVTILIRVPLTFLPIIIKVTPWRRRESPFLLEVLSYKPDIIAYPVKEDPNSL
jgi:hypothetical protein